MKNTLFLLSGLMVIYEEWWFIRICDWFMIYDWMIYRHAMMGCGLVLVKCEFYPPFNVAAWMVVPQFVRLGNLLSTVSRLIS